MVLCFGLRQLLEKALGGVCPVRQVDRAGLSIRHKSYLSLDTLAPHIMQENYSCCIFL